MPLRHEKRLCRYIIAAYHFDAAMPLWPCCFDAMPAMPCCRHDAAPCRYCCRYYAMRYDAMIFHYAPRAALMLLFRCRAAIAAFRHDDTPLLPDDYYAMPLMPLRS